MGQVGDGDDDGGSAGLVHPLLRSIAESSPVTMMWLGLDYRIEFINRVLPGLTMAQVVGTSVFDWVPAEQHPAMRECFRLVMETGEVGTYDNVHPSPAGPPVMWESRVARVERDGEVVGFVLFASDVTQQRALEAQLMQSQKMEAIGQLAGGIAHDFNNLMLAVTANVEFARRAAAGQPELLQHLHAADLAAERATVLTRQLLAMSRQQALSTRVVDLDRLAADMVGMLRRLIPASIEIELYTGDTPATIEADPNKIEQVVLNLALNARDAMPRGGRLVLRTRRVTLDPSHLAEVPGAAPGDYVLLSVSDNGRGMDAATLERVFEPFFTTKPVGTGTGLGLSTVYGVVEQHGGTIRVASLPQVGSTFDVYLPFVASAPPVAEAPAAGPATGGHETILVAEDEALVRSVVVRQLTRAGYRVREACDGDEAVAVLAHNPAGIDLALLDVVMPRATGPRAYLRMQEIRPDLVVAFTTGYNDPRWVETDLPPGARVLAKPYHERELLAFVRAALDGDPVDD